MKNLMIFVLAAISLTSVSFAEEWFRVEASVRPVQVVVFVHVKNDFSGDITCRGLIEGKLSGSGTILRRYFENLNIKQGEGQSVQLLSREMIPFNSAFAEVECKLI